ncbi:MAG: Phosphate regulon transcriptional regulatory protein PhoB [Firmicutes bacterium ADurb.BinA052]|nr:MAG: Phosphate regulon transcriptional regulatory protein PhoB [Firmicutes bacterium ADurb.BinA052]
MSGTRVIIADDRREVRSGLRALLEEEQARFVIMEAADLRQLMPQLQQSCVDLVLLDWELGPVSGPDILAMLKGVCPNTPVVALSARPEARNSALASGATAFILKADCVETVLAAVRSAIGSRDYDQRKEEAR